MVDDKKTSNSSWPVRIIEKTNKSIIFNVLKAIIPKFLRTKIKLFLNIIEYKLNKIICFIILKTELRSKLKNKLDIFLDTKQQILFKETIDEPLLSIIITAFNSAELTLECFRCLLNAMLDIKCECIIVDNASTDSTKELLKQFVGIKVIQNTTNEGFIKAVNKAAKVAKGKYLLLLNNNVFVEPSSILALVKKMESLNNIGVVGSKIVLLDGSLQEAGCVVWNNGSTRAYGRGCKPNDEEFSFVRDVDFCSGASLLIRKALFDKLNGFDENFSPAYYEETDFCVRSWQEGYRVVYEPRSVVHNFKCGSNNKVNAFALMKRNHKYFYNKHKQILALYLPSSKNNVILARNHLHNKKRILIIDDRIPFTWLGAGYPRMSKIIEELLECDVQLTFFAMKKNSENITELYKYFADSCEFIWSKGKDGLLDMLGNRNNYFDIIIISREHNKQFFDNIYSEIYKYIANCKIIYDAEAIVAIRTALRSVISGDSLPQHKIDDMLKKEVKLADNADKVVVVNEHEMKIFKQYSAKPIFELGHCLNITPTKNNFSERKDFIFVGRLEEDGSPNVDSIMWYFKEIFPIIKSRLGEQIKLYIAGLCSAKSLQNIHDSSICFLGKVDNLSNIYNNCRVFIAPTRFAAGIPHKVHEAAAFGVPAVVTKLLASQLAWDDDVSVLVADNPEVFADKCVALYSDEYLWNRIRNNAIASAEHNCSYDKFRTTVKQIIAF